MNEHPANLDVIFEPFDNERLVNLCGQFDEHLHQLEKRLGVEISNRGNIFQLSGDEKSLPPVSRLLKKLYAVTEDEQLSAKTIHLYLQESGVESLIEEADDVTREVVISTRKNLIRGRGSNQRSYLENILSHDINFGIGPAGTGKTYLAVACAVNALEQEQVRRIVLVRPAVEAGERLGFLPGDLSQKIDPYLRPLYDALYEMMGFDRVGKLIEQHVIEVAPLAFMRGRTLNESFIILDEAQNTTREQMKMFLTRIGFNSTAVVTGDITQTDLPNMNQSGLLHVKAVLKNIKGISFNYFTSKDVVRHPLVQRIVSAYESHDD